MKNTEREFTPAFETWMGDMQMDYDYSGTLKKLLKKPGKPILQFVLLVCICLCAAFGVFSYIGSMKNVNAQTENIETFDPVVPNVMDEKLAKNLPYDVTPPYSSLTPQFLSKSFASFNYDTVNYCIAIDADYYPCIVAIDADNMEPYQELIEYTHSDSTDIPAPVTMKGMPQKIEGELVEMSIDAINTFYGEEVADTSNYKEIIGTLYLDTTRKPVFEYSAAVVSFLFMAALVIIYWKAVIPKKQHRKRHQDTLDTYYGSALLNIEKELNDPSALCLEPQKLYITANYLISKVNGLEIIPTNEIVQVYGFFTKEFPKKEGTIAVTKDGVKHEIARISFTGSNNFRTERIVEKMKNILPDIKYGFDSGLYTETNISPSEADTESQSNLPLGILGAIIGAALGGVLWIVIGKIGFIAGIAGFVMVMLAMKCYAIFAGSIDRRGQIISICIAFLMIFAANYTSYALDICEANDSVNIEGLINAFKTLPGLMTAANLWGSFAIDLVVGYALSIWSSFRLIKRAFSSTK